MPIRRRRILLARSAPICRNSAVHGTDRRDPERFRVFEAPDCTYLAARPGRPHSGNWRASENAMGTPGPWSRQARWVTCYLLLVRFAVCHLHAHGLLQDQARRPLI